MGCGPAPVTSGNLVSPLEPWLQTQSHSESTCEVWGNMLSPSQGPGGCAWELPEAGSSTALPRREGVQEQLEAVPWPGPPSS